MSDAPSLAALAAKMAASGASLTVETPDGGVLTAGADPSRARVCVRTPAAAAALHRGEQLAIAPRAHAGLDGPGGTSAGGIVCVR